MLVRISLAALLTASAALACPVDAAIYKWVDDSGVTHYGDRVPPQFANKSTLSLKTTGVPVAIGEASPKPAQSGATQPAAQNPQATKQQLDQQRQDAALLSTYTSEAEIDAARARELKSHQDAMKVTTAGFAKSNSPEDKRKLEMLITRGQQQTDAINAKFDAQKTRFRELKAAPPAAQASAAPPPPAAPTR